MELELSGKRALVTGSSSGLGEATAVRPAAEGASVVVHGRDHDRTVSVVKAIRDAGAAATFAADGGWYG